MIKRVDKRLQAVQCLTGNKIKIIACITMLIDHFSKIFLESIMNDKLFPLYLAGGMSTEQFYGIDAFQKNIPSTMDRLLEKKNLELLETRNFNLRQENKELKEALEEERSFSDRLLEGIDRVLDMLESHLPKQLLHLVDKARDLLPEHQTYRQEKQHERGHSWGDMSL
mgnify:CR=1 FL=1